jgi:two-component system, LytTR family, response regulator
MSTIKVAIAEDELMARKRLVRLLEAMPGVELVGAHEDAKGVLDQLREDAIDVLVLDVQMPGLTGLEAHALVPEGGPFVIFATAHPEHAVAAFELGAVDYVLKPIEAGRLGKAIERARKWLADRAATRRAAVATVDAGAPDRLAVSTRAGIVLVDPFEVSHAEFDGSLVTIHRTSGEPLLADGSLQDVADRLPDDVFERVHRRALVNLREITMLEPLPTGGFVAVTRAGGRVPVSRQSARRLRRWLGLGKATADDEGEA